MTVLWLFVAAIWGTALAGRPPATPALRHRPTPEAGSREPTPWEWVAQRYGDYRTDEQIRKGNWLYFAALDGDEAKARQALDAGADPNARSLDPCGLGYTPLMAASSEGYEGLVALLLVRGANPNLGYDGDTPLSLAVREGHADVARRLAAAGAHDVRSKGASRPAGPNP